MSIVSVTDPLISIFKYYLLVPPLDEEDIFEITIERDAPAIREAEESLIWSEPAGRPIRCSVSQPAL